MVSYQLRQIHVRLSEKYDEISWVFRVFIGGAFNIMFLNAFWEFLSPHFIFQPDGTIVYETALLDSLLPQLAALVIAVLVSPFILSLFLTKRKPELKIVPPSYITLISFAWVMVSLYSPFKRETAIIALFGLVLTFFGFTEDRLITSILGLATERESIYFEHLLVFADIDDAKARFSVPEIRNCLHLSDKVDGNDETGYIFRRRKGYDFVEKIWLTRNEQLSESTDVKIVYYQKGKFNLRISPDFLENSRKNSAYVREVLLNHEPSLKFEVVNPLSNSIRDPIIDSVIDDLVGYYAKYKRFSGWDLIKIGAFIGLLIATGVLFVYNFSTVGALIAVIDVLLALLEFPDIVRRQS